MTRKFVLLSGGALVSLSASHMPLMAQDVRTEVEAAVSAGYQNNPFLEAAGGGSGILTTIEINPAVFLEDESSLVTIRGGARLNYFPDGDRTNDAFSLRATVGKQASERLSLSAGANFSTSRNQLLDQVFTNGPVLGDDNELPDPDLIDVTFAGDRLRSTRFGFNAGANLQLTPVSRLSTSISSSWNEFDGIQANDFAITRLQAQYSRDLSETVSLGVLGAISYSTFDGIANALINPVNPNGESLIFDARGTLNASFSPTARLSVQAGVSVVEFDLGALGEETNTVASGSASFCDEAIGGSLCLTAARTARPTALGGITTVSTISAGWNRQLSARDSFSISATYSDVEVPDTSLQPLLQQQPPSRIFGTTASYQRQIGRDFGVFLRGNFSDVSTEFGEFPATYGVQVGLRKRFGEPR